MRVRLAPWLLLLGLLSAWEGGVASGALNPVLTSSPSRVLAVLPELARSPQLATDLGYSGQVFGFAILCAIGVGTTLGVLIGLSPLAHRLIHPPLLALNAVPKVALMPLLVLWLGVGFSSGLFLSSLMATFPIAVSTATGMRVLDRDAISMARAFGASRRLRLTEIILPGIVPYVVSGLRVGMSYALVGTLLAEFFAASEGVGYRMVMYMANFEVDAFFACLLFVVCFALIGHALLRVLERRVLVDAPDGWSP